MAEPVDLFAVQVRASPRDFVRAESFADHMEALVRQIDAQRPRANDGGHARPALAVFPAHLGTWLVLEGLPAPVAQRAARCEIALGMVAARHPALFSWAMARRRGGGLVGTAVLARARRMHEIYHATFAHLAREFRLTIVAGSILAPENALGPDAPILEERSADLYNLSYTFDERGLGVAVTKQVHLTPTLEDGLGVSTGQPEAVVPVAAPWGRFATLVGYDGFHEPHTRRETFLPLPSRLDALGVDVLAQPAANPWRWNARCPLSEPGEEILRRDQWRNEGLAAGLGGCANVRYGVTAHLCGRLYELRFEGRSEILTRGSSGEVRVVSQAPRIDGETVVRATAFG